MLLAIDVGNSNVVVGLFMDGELRNKWRLQSSTRRTTDEYAVLVRGLLEAEGAPLNGFRGAIISSVVTQLTRVFRKLAVQLLGREPVVVSAGIRTGMPIRMDNPREVGADRIVNAVAAYEHYRQEVIVVDFGTATTFDVVSSDGCYMGGCITPGIAVALDALIERTDKLPPVEILRPERVVGRNTVHSIQSGIYYGYLSLIEGIINRIVAEQGFRPRVVATGGLGNLFAEETNLFDHYCHDLTLQGLKILFERNQDD